MITDVTALYNFGKVVTVGLLILYILFQHYTVKELLIYFAIAAVVIGVFLKSASIPLLLVLLAIAAKELDFREFVRFDFRVKLFFFFVILFLYVLDVIPNVEGYYGAGEYGAYKYSMGFQHPNTFAIFVFSIIIEWIYFNYSKIRWYDIAIILLVTMATVFISFSRASTLSFLFIFVVALVLRGRNISRLPMVVKGLISLLPLVCFLISYGVTASYKNGNQFVRDLDVLVSHRIRLQSQYLEKFGVSLFGNQVADETAHVVIDNAYMNSLIIFGILFSAVFCIVYIMLLFETMNRNDTPQAVMILFVFMMGFAEMTLLLVCFNITALNIFKTIQNPFRRIKAEGSHNE